MRAADVKCDGSIRRLRDDASNPLGVAQEIDGKERFRAEPCIRPVQPLTQSDLDESSCRQSDGASSNKPKKTTDIAGNRAKIGALDP